MSPKFFLILFIINSIQINKIICECTSCEKYKPCFEATTSFEKNRALCQKLCGSEDPSLRCHSVTGHCECGTNRLFQQRIHSACEPAEADSTCAKQCNVRAQDGVLCQAKRPLQSFQNTEIYCLCVYNPNFPGRETNFMF